MEHTSTVIDLVAAITTLLLIAAAVLAISKRLKLPFTVMLVVVGIGLAELANYSSALGPLQLFHISPDVILFVFLPTLIFESSLHLDAREVKRNLLPVLTLAVPGLLISTAIIATVVSFFTAIDFTAALVLGAILSATDPVAVISLFKQLGAPRRLTILVEGESLFNDATAIVASQILLAIAVAGYVSGQTIVSGIGDFFFVFLGGALVGWVLAVIVGFVLGHVEGDPMIEISLTTILAYFSFLLAEHVLHVSGVMATVAAALTIGGWGRSKISHSVSEYLENFWEYLAFFANALIFLLVGLQIDLIEVAASWQMLVWVILSMLIARAIVVFTLVPLVGRLPGSELISGKYQVVMYWGGLRGAIALAIVLSLGEFRYADTFVILVIGAVLFTLLIQGLTIEPLIKYLKLHHPPLADRLAMAEANLDARRVALEQLPKLQQQAGFSARIATHLRTQYQLSVDTAEESFEQQRKEELDDTQEFNLLLLKCFSVQKAFYREKLGRGHLTEQTYRNLVYALNVEGDSLRYFGALPKIPPRSRWRIWLRNSWMRVVQSSGLFDGYAESIRSHATAQDYEYAWAGYQGCNEVLTNIDELSRQSYARKSVVRDVRELFSRWARGARRKLDTVAEEFPEFHHSSQRRLAHRMALHAQRDFIASQRRSGAVPNGVATAMMSSLDKELLALRGYDTAHLKIEADELLKKIPVFSALPDSEIPHVLSRIKQRTIPARQDLTREGERGDALFFIARGKVRVLQTIDGNEIELAQLDSGDFFGEKGLGNSEIHLVTCRALTPCAVYELRRSDLEALKIMCPQLVIAIRDILGQRELCY